MKNFIILFAFLILSTRLMAQATNPTDSLFNSMNSDNKKENVSIFETSRLILSQSTETVKKKNLNFLVIHRFGDFAGTDGGGKFDFGLDDVADVYIGFEYGLTNDLNIDIGRSTLPMAGGLWDIELKYAVLHQTNDDSSPLAITLIAEPAIRLYNSYPGFNDRMSYFGQVIFARKFSHGFSLQIAPSIVQDNQPIPDVPGNEKAFLSVSASARLRVSKLMGIVVDYAHPFSSYRDAHAFSDPIGVGFQVATGGHVFTLNISNSRAASEINYLSNTTSVFPKGQYRLGFTISRMFDFNHEEHYNPKK